SASCSDQKQQQQMNSCTSSVVDVNCLGPSGSSLQPGDLSNDLNNDIDQMEAINSILSDNFFPPTSHCSASGQASNALDNQHSSLDSASLLLSNPGYIPYGHMSSTSSLGGNASYRQNSSNMNGGYLGSSGMTNLMGSRQAIGIPDYGSDAVLDEAVKSIL